MLGSPISQYRKKLAHAMVMGTPRAGQNSPAPSPTPNTQPHFIAIPGAPHNKSASLLSGELLAQYSLRKNTPLRASQPMSETLPSLHFEGRGNQSDPKLFHLGPAHPIAKYLLPLTKDWRNGRKIVENYSRCMDGFHFLEKHIMKALTGEEVLHNAAQVFPEKTTPQHNEIVKTFGAKTLPQLLNTLDVPANLIPSFILLGVDILEQITRKNRWYETFPPPLEEWRTCFLEDFPQRMEDLWLPLQKDHPHVLPWLALSRGGNGENYYANSLITPYNIKRYIDYELPSQRTKQFIGILDANLNEEERNFWTRLDKPGHLLMTAILKYPASDSDTLKLMGRIYQLIRERFTFQAFDETIAAFESLPTGSQIELDSNLVIEVLKQEKEWLLRSGQGSYQSSHLDMGYAQSQKLTQQNNSPGKEIIHDVLTQLQRHHVKVYDIDDWKHLIHITQGLLNYPNKDYDWSIMPETIAGYQTQFPGKSASWYLARYIAELPPPPPEEVTKDWKLQKWQGMGPELAAREFCKTWLESHEKPDWLDEMAWQALKSEVSSPIGGKINRPFESLEGKKLLGLLTIISVLDPKEIDRFKGKIKKAETLDHVFSLAPHWMWALNQVNTLEYSQVKSVDTFWKPAINGFQPNNYEGAKLGDFGYALLQLERIARAFNSSLYARQSEQFGQEQQKIFHRLLTHLNHPSPYAPYHFLAALDKVKPSEMRWYGGENPFDKSKKRASKALEESGVVDQTLHYDLVDFLCNPAIKNRWEDFGEIAGAIGKHYPASLPEVSQLPAVQNEAEYNFTLVQALRGETSVIPKLLELTQQDRDYGFRIICTLVSTLFPLHGEPYDTFKQELSEKILGQYLTVPQDKGGLQKILFPTFTELSNPKVPRNTPSIKNYNQSQLALLAMLLLIQVPKNFDWSPVLFSPTGKEVIEAILDVKAAAPTTKVTLAQEFFTRLPQGQYPEGEEENRVLYWLDEIAELLQWTPPEVLRPLMGNDHAPQNWTLLNKIIRIFTGDMDHIQESPELQQLAITYLDELEKAVSVQKDRPTSLQEPLYGKISPEFPIFLDNLKKLKFLSHPDFILSHILKLDNGPLTSTANKLDFDALPQTDFVKWLRDVPDNQLLTHDITLPQNWRNKLEELFFDGGAPDPYHLNIRYQLFQVLNRDLTALDNLTDQFMFYPTLPYALLLIAQRLEGSSHTNATLYDEVNQYAHTIRQKIAQGLMEREGYPPVALFRAMLRLQSPARSGYQVRLLKQSDPQLLPPEEWQELFKTLPPEKQTLSAKLIRWMQGDPDGLIEAMPQLMSYDMDDPESYLNRGPVYVGDWLKADVEDFYYYQKPEREGIVHPNLSELMTLLRHPQMQWWQKQAQTHSHFSNGITYLNHFLINGLDEVKGKTLDLWEDAANMGLSFRFWRFDTASIKGMDGAQIHPPLFTQYGFQQIPYPQENWTFGPGFLITQNNRPLDWALHPDTTITFRRGYLMASHPDHGALLIRNSSKVFGRDLFDYPAYFTPASNAPKASECLTFNPKHETFETAHKLSDEEKSFPLGQAWYPITDVRVAYDDRRVAHAQFLMDELKALKADYQKWKFNVEPDAMVPNPDPATAEQEPTVFRGYMTPGFQAIIDYYSEALYQRSNIDRAIAQAKGGLDEVLELQRKKPILPDLAFVEDDTPIYGEIPYSKPHWQGNRLHQVPARRLTVDHVILSELQDLILGDWSPITYAHSPLIPFLQAGINAEAELVLLEPEQEPRP